MKQDTIRFQRLRPEAILPVRATEGSAGLDLTACIDQPVVLPKGGRALIPTGLAVALPGNHLASFIFARSGLAVKHGVTLSNCVGVVDSDYRGEIKVGLINQGESDYTIQPGERIAQLVVMPVCCLPVEECDRLDETGRGVGGFGSTGKI